MHSSDYKRLALPRTRQIGVLEATVFVLPRLYWLLHNEELPYATGATHHTVGRANVGLLRVLETV